MTIADLLAVFGRFHPVVLHMPIGLLTAVAILESLSLAKPKWQLRQAIAILVWVAAASGVTAAVTGFILGGESGYKGDTVDTHRILGIIVGCLCVVLAVVHQASRGGAKGGVLWGYRALVLVAMGLLLPAAHLGGTMSHGANFLWEPITKKNAPSGDPNAPANDSTFTMVIQPILNAKCITCHGEDKQKGELAVDNTTELLKGGKGGPIFVAGDPARSAMIVRLRLPINDEHHMPPDEKPQPTAEEIGVIEAWIRAGATVTGKVDLTPAGVERTPSTESTPKPAKPNATVAAASPAALAALETALVHVSPMSPEDNLLTIDFAACAGTTDDAIATGLLKAVVLQAGDLSLARTRITDAVLDTVAQMPNLRRLDLRGTEITGEGLAKLATLTKLQDIVVAKTKLSPAAAKPLAAIPGLRRVYAWMSGLESDGIAALKAARPEMIVDFGDTTGGGADKPPEPEPAFKFTSEAPPPTTPTPAAAAASLTPINTVCPVSGAPLDPRYSVVYEGKVIGFCCSNCPKEFWADPAKFLAKLK